MDPSDLPSAPESPPTVDELLARVAALEAERDEARREAAATERRVVATLAGDLAALGRRARAEYGQRLARGEGMTHEKLLHHAEAFEYVAVELARSFGGEVAAAITPPAPPPGEAPVADPPSVESPPGAPAPSEFALEID